MWQKYLILRAGEKVSLQKILINRHMENIHKTDSEKPPAIECAVCDGAFQIMSIVKKNTTLVNSMKGIQKSIPLKVIIVDKTIFYYYRRNSNSKLQ